MIVTYLRSSSVGTYQMCPMKYFLGYTLGWKEPSNKAAEKGTIVHKVLELLGEIKLTQQIGKRKTFQDEHIGRVHAYKYDLDDLIKRCTDFYVSHSKHNWSASDKKHCSKSVYEAIEYHGGEYDPRNLHIIKAEQPFDFEINKPWAMYDYTMPDGTKLEGFLALKGTIDLVSKIDDETYHITDYKNGRRINWATMEEKTHSTLQEDHQLMMYYYAVQQLYPDIDHFQITIYFINDGGPYTICYSKEDLPRIENMIKKYFEDIKNTELPPLNKSWKCKKFCHFGKTTFRGTNVQPIKESREGQVTPKGECMTKCEQTLYTIERRSMDSVMKHMTAPNYDIEKYDAPGDIKQDTSGGESNQ